MSSDQPAHNEIVIVRRRGGEEEGHHGGVWKIAYADFMTAMMAFFLVMWLVNAADKKVLTQVASYFNPLRMSERVTADKGVEDMVEGAEQQSKKASVPPESTAETKTSDNHSKDESKKEKKEKKENAKNEKEEKSTENSQTHMTEQELFNDPYGILEKLAAQAIVGKQGGSESNTGMGSDQAGGDAFRDPFDPNFNRVEKGGVKSEAEAQTADDPNRKTAAQGTKGDGGTPKAVEQAAAAVEKVKEQSSAGQKEAAQMQEKLEQAVAGFAQNLRPAIEVKSTEDGLLISLTDQFDFDMFKISSAEPNAQLVAVMKRMGEVLNTILGPIIIRGHTDGRVFKKGTSDNWRLSTQRALMARYMLLNGGIPPERVERVEGYADTLLRVKSDPLAAQNRRIEILLKKKSD